jgi:glycosyltransferase involved in cell wall biosynthesis
LDRAEKLVSEAWPGFSIPSGTRPVKIVSPLWKLSVITPVFNGIRFIEFCIKNVIEQNCPDVEHIIVDGGSSDGTIEVIKRYASEYPHIRWISEKDRGQSDAMNKGIAMAGSSIIGFLNVDDFYEPGTLNEVIEHFLNLQGPALLVGNCNIWDDNEKLLEVNKPSGINLINLLRGRYNYAFPMNPSAYFYHKSLHEQIGPYEVGEHYGMDLHFIFKAVQKAQVKYIDKTWGNYRYLAGTKTFEDDKNGMNSVRVTRITEQYRKQQPVSVKGHIAFLEMRDKIMGLVHRAGSIVGRK